MKRRSKVLLSILIIVIAVSAIEFSLRLFGVQPGVYVTHRLNPYEFNSEFGWITRKNSAYLRASPAYVHYNYYNPQGLPTTYENREKLIKRDPPKVALIGNSFVESYYQPYEKSFPFLVNQKLKGLEVLNLGVSGYSLGQDLLQARKYIPQFNVNQIIIFFVPFQDIKVLNSQTFPGGYAKPVFGSDLSKPVNTPLVNLMLQKKSQFEDYSTIATILQPLLNKWFGYINSHFKYAQHSDYHEYPVYALADALRYSKQIELETKVSSVTTLYIPSDFEYGNVEMLSLNFKNFLDTCKEMQIKCAIPDFFVNKKENYREIFDTEDHHLSEVGSKKMANFLAKYISNSVH